MEILNNTLSSFQSGNSYFSPGATACGIALLTTALLVYKKYFHISTIREGNCTLHYASRSWPRFEEIYFRVDKLAPLKYSTLPTKLKSLMSQKLKEFEEKTHLGTVDSNDDQTDATREENPTSFHYVQHVTYPCGSQIYSNFAAYSFNIILPKRMPEENSLPHNTAKYSIHDWKIKFALEQS